MFSKASFLSVVKSWDCVVKGSPYYSITENFPMRFCALKCGGVGVDSDTVWNEFYTSTAARMVCIRYIYLILYLLQENILCLEESVLFCFLSWEKVTSITQHAHVLTLSQTTNFRLTN